MRKLKKVAFSHFFDTLRLRVAEPFIYANSLLWWAYPSRDGRCAAGDGIFPSGWFGRYGNTSGLWIPAVATPSCTTCLSRLRWFVPGPSTT